MDRIEGYPKTTVAGVLKLHSIIQEPDKCCKLLRRRIPRCALDCRFLAGKRNVFDERYFNEFGIF